MENSNENNLDRESRFNKEQKDETINAENDVTNITKPTVNHHTSKTEMSSVTVLFQKAFEVYKFNFWKFIGLMLIPVIIVIIFMAIVSVAGIFGLSAIRSLGDTGLIMLIIAMITMIIAILFISIIVQASMLILVRDSEKNLNFKELLVEGKKIAIKLFTLKFVAGLFIFLWMLLLIVPGIIAAVYYSLVGWVLVYEGSTGLNAIKRSKELVEGYWWAVFGRFAAVYGTFYLISAVPSVLGSDALSFLVSILSFIVAPLFLVYSCFIYWDLVRIKGEQSN
jgi:hypothetical protein